MTEFYTSKELREKNSEQLSKIVAERREKYRHMRFQVSSKEIKNHRELRELRHEIARIMTIMNEKINAEKKV